MARLIEELRKLPGVGNKSAQRLAFHILRSDDRDAEALSTAIREVKERLRLCSICNNITDVDPCLYCASPTRNQRLVCVVEEPTNIATIEKTRSWNGVFHVLHGTLSPLHGVGPSICARRTLSPAPSGARWTRSSWLPRRRSKAKRRRAGWPTCCGASGVRITRIATGVPAGSDIEYADEVTMTRALEGRHEV